MMVLYAIAKDAQNIDERRLDYFLQPGAIWTTGFHTCSILAQVMHYNESKKLVFCIQKTNYGYKDIEPDTYGLDQFLENFAFVGIKE